MRRPLRGDETSSAGDARGKERKERYLLARSKTKSCARHSTSPAQSRIPADVASRTPLTMLAAVEFGLYLRESGVKRSVSPSVRRAIEPERTFLGYQGRPRSREESYSCRLHPR